MASSEAAGASVATGGSPSTDEVRLDLVALALGELGQGQQALAVLRQERRHVDHARDALGQRAAACVAAIPPMLCGTSTAGSSRSPSFAQTRSA